MENEKLRVKVAEYEKIINEYNGGENDEYKYSVGRIRLSEYGREIKIDGTTVHLFNDGR